MERAKVGVEKKKSLWSFGTREVVYAAIGAALYVVFSLATGWLNIPGSGNVQFRPAVAIPMFFGVAFGPIVGFLAGFLGNIINDLIMGYGFWFWWDLGVGLLGLFTGLVAARIVNYADIKSIILAEVMVIVGVFVGMGVASISEMWVSGADWNTVLINNFLPAAIPDWLNGLILVPILMVAYNAVVARSGR